MWAGKCGRWGGGHLGASCLWLLLLPPSDGTRWCPLGPGREFRTECGGVGSAGGSPGRPLSSPPLSESAPGPRSPGDQHTQAACPDKPSSSCLREQADCCVARTSQAGGQGKPEPGTSTSTGQRALPQPGKGEGGDGDRVYFGTSQHLKGHRDHFTTD